MKQSNEWKRVVVTPDSHFFPVFQSAIKKVEPGKERMTIKVINKKKSAAIRTKVNDTFRFEFEWQGDDVCSIDVFKKEC